MASEAQDPGTHKPAQSPAGEGGADKGSASEAPSAEAQIAKLSDEKRDLNDRMLRLAAEFENYKRRSRKEMEDAGLRALEPLLKELLPVLDNLDRAIGAAKTANTPGTAALLEGVQLVQKQFLSALEKFQVKPFDAEGKPFDPQFHEGIQQVESDTLPAGTVATVFQRGYMAGNKLLRPAMVSVVRGGAQGAAAAKPGDSGLAN